MDKAAANGHLDVVKFLHGNRQEGCTTQEMDEGAANGHLDVIKSLHENRVEGCTEEALNKAACGGHLEVVRFLVEHRNEGCTGSAMEGAIQYGHLAVVQFLHEHLCCNDEITFSANNAANAGFVSVVAYLSKHSSSHLSVHEIVHCTESVHLMATIRMLEHGKVEDWTTLVLDHAASVGNLEAVKYLHTHRTEGCTANAMDGAASAGHLEVVKYLHENRSEGCTKRAMDGAAAHGAVDVLWILREHRKEGCTSKAVGNAALKGHVDVIEFLLEHYDVPVTARALENAVSSGKVEVVDILLPQNPPDNLSKLMCLAAGKGNRQMFKYLCELTPADTKTLGQCLVEVTKTGDWHFVKFLLPKVTGSKWISSAIEEAASMGDLDIVELLLSRGKPFEPNQPFAFMNAAALGNFDLLQILESAYNSEHENIRRGNQWRFALVVLTGGHMEIFTWAFQRVVPLYRAELMARAASAGYLDAIQELCRFRFSVTSNALISAASSGHLDILQFLHQRQKKSATSLCFMLLSKVALSMWSSLCTRIGPTTGVIPLRWIRLQAVGTWTLFAFSTRIGQKDVRLKRWIKLPLEVSRHYVSYTSIDPKGAQRKRWRMLPSTVAYIRSSSFTRTVRRGVR